MQNFSSILPDTFLCPISFNQSHTSVFYDKIVENENNSFKNVSKHLSKQRKITQTKSKITIYQLANHNVFTNYQFDQQVDAVRIIIYRAFLLILSSQRHLIFTTIKEKVIKNHFINENLQWRNSGAKAETLASLD